MRPTISPANKENFLETISIGGVLTFGSRLKRLGDLLFSQAQELFRRRYKNFKPGWFSFLITLKNKEIKDLKTIASELNISTSAASQVMRVLHKEKLIQIKCSNLDSRYKDIQITAKALEILKSIIPELILIEDTIQELLKEDSDTVIARLAHIENELRRKPFYDRTLSSINIVEFSDKLAKDFDRLNRAWLEKTNYELQEYDELQLKKPYRSIIKVGGEILFAMDDQRAVGAIALVHHSNCLVEISKMGVDDNYRGLGIGNLLMGAAITKARDKSYKEILIITNSKLKPAIALYEKFGFTLIPTSKEAKLKYGPRADLSYKLIL
jgi:ribosomal protein S18 acetylase RimI-like enzyme